MTDRMQDRKIRIRTRGVRLSVLLALWGALSLVIVWAASIGPDSFGYVATDNTPYSFVNISSTGVAVLAGADDDKAIVNVGFPFSFYGTPYSSVCVSTNGLLALGGCIVDFANQDLTGSRPSGDLPVIAPLWFDLTFSAKGAGAIYYQTLGQPGDRRFVIQWQNAYPLNGTEGITFQTILYETTGKILFQYLDIDAGAGSPASFGRGATVGIRDTNGQANGRRLQWSHRMPALSNGLAIQFIPDAVGPVITGMPAPGLELWPPDNKLVKVATITASDAGTGLASLNVTATSNEPEGNDKDIFITGSGSQYVVELRAQREGSGKGRIYTITATATDKAGNKSTVTSTVTVPHDKK